MGPPIPDLFVFQILSNSKPDVCISLCADNECMDKMYENDTSKSMHKPQYSR